MNPLRFSAKHLLALASPIVVALTPDQAHAILTYNIFESGPDVVVQTKGSINLPVDAVGNINCLFDGFIRSATATLCTGPSGFSPRYFLASGPPIFNGSVSIGPANSVSGITTSLRGLNFIAPRGFAIDSSYVSGTPVVSSATFSNTTLASLGFTTTGLIGTWTLDETGDTINIVLGPTEAVPAPLPMFGAVVAFGWSRNLRRRITASRVMIKN